MQSKSLFATALALSVGLATAMAQAETFRAATYTGANSPNSLFFSDFVKELDAATRGKMKFELYSGGSLLPPEGSLKGLAAGIAQMAQITGNYIPADLPYTSVITDLSFVADDQLALAFAYTEAKLFNKQLVNELKEKNVVFGTGYVIGVYNVICVNPVSRIEDMAGKKIRAITFPQIEFMKSVGAVPVNVVATELYTGLQRGSIDCAAGSPEFLTVYFKLAEVAKSVYRLPLGSNANDGYYFNKRWWQQRTPEERQTLLKVMSRATAKSMMGFAATIEDAWKVARDNKIALIEPEAAARARLAAFKERYIAELPKYAKEKRGVGDAEELVKDFLARQEKWKKLLATVDKKDLNAMTALLDREIFDKIDVKTYGMN